MIVVVAASLAVVLALPAMGATRSNFRTRSSLPKPSSPVCYNSDPYKLSRAVQSACKIKRFPLKAVKALPGGGKAYIYIVDGYKTVFPVPPKGFNALKASAKRRAEYNLPPRPAGGPELKVWNKLMSHLHVGLQGPYIAQINLSAGRQNYVNWAGHMVGPYSYNRVNSVYARWVEPHIYRTRCSNTQESTWAGLGGNPGNGYLAQAGTLKNHHAWYEVLPRKANIYRNFGARAGRQLRVHVRYVHPRNRRAGWNFHLANLYTGHQRNPYVVAPKGKAGHSAEVITERPVVNHHYTYLSNFGTVHVLGAYANGNTARHAFGRFGRRNAINMKVGRTTLASTTNLFRNGVSFNTTQHNCKP